MATSRAKLSFHKASNFLGQAKPFRVLNSLQQFVLELLPGGVRGQVEQVEAGVGHGEVVVVAGLLDVHVQGLHA